MKKGIMALFVLLLSVSYLTYGITVSSYSTDKVSYEPGDQGVLNLNISFDYPVSSTETLVGFESVYVKASSPIATKTINIGKISKGTMAVSIPLNIDKEAKEGIYSISLEIGGSALVEKGSTTNSKVATTRTSIPVKVVKTPSMTVELNPKEINKEGKTSMVVCAENGIARDVYVSSTTLSLEGGKAFLGDVDGCKEKNVSYDASLLNEGVNTVSFVVDYKDRIGGDHSVSISLPITVSKQSTRFTIVQDGEITHKEEEKLKLVLENRGSRASDVRIKADENLVFPGISELYIGEIGVGEKKSIAVNAYTTLSPGKNPVKFTINWKEEGKEKSTEVSVPISVKAGNAIGVFLEATPLPLRKKGEHSLSVVVANKASYRISGVSVAISSDAFDVLDIQKERFIGSLEPDDFSSQQFKIKVKDVNNGKANVSVKYSDPSGKTYTLTKEFELSIEEPEKGKQDLLLPIVAVIAVGAGGWYYLKGKKKHGK
ncbi:MAG: hypothetical protein D6769_02990 [Methanobacteriota archaeon]|nr:MAG: hypothetical protein D6769_02990 [Euryarchaeota archaeon]